MKSILSKEINKMFDIYFANPLSIDAIEEKELTSEEKREKKVKEEIRKFFIIKNVRLQQDESLVGKYAMLISPLHIVTMKYPAVIYSEGGEDYKLAKRRYKLLVEKPFNKLKSFFDYQIKEIDRTDVPKNILYQIEKVFIKNKKRLLKPTLGQETEEQKIRETESRRIREEKEIKDPKKSAKYLYYEKEAKKLKFDGNIILKDIKYAEEMREVWMDYRHKKTAIADKVLSTAALHKINVIDKELKILSRERLEWKRKFNYLLFTMNKIIDKKVFTEKMLFNLLLDLGYNELLKGLKIGSLVKENGKKK